MQIASAGAGGVGDGTRARIEGEFNSFLLFYHPFGDFPIKQIPASEEGFFPGPQQVRKALNPPTLICSDPLNYHPSPAEMICIFKNLVSDAFLCSSLDLTLRTKHIIGGEALRGIVEAWLPQKYPRPPL